MPTELGVYVKVKVNKPEGTEACMVVALTDVFKKR